MISLICFVFAFVFALLSSFGWPTPTRVHLGWLAVAFIALGFALQGVTFLR